MVTKPLTLVNLDGSRRLGYAFEMQSSRRGESSPSFPRKRESSAPTIGLIVPAHATSPMRTNTLGPWTSAFAGVTVCSLRTKNGKILQWPC